MNRKQRIESILLPALKAAKMPCLTSTFACQLPDSSWVAARKVPASNCAKVSCQFIFNSDYLINLVNKKHYKYVIKLS